MLLLLCIGVLGLGYWKACMKLFWLRNSRKGV